MTGNRCVRGIVRSALGLLAILACVGVSPARAESLSTPYNILGVQPSSPFIAGAPSCFDIAVGPNPISINSLEVQTSLLPTQAGATFGCTVLITPTSFYGKLSSSAGWSVASTGTGLSAGPLFPSHITLNTPFTLQANTKYGVMVALQNGAATQAAAFSAIALFSNSAVSNADLTITMGATVQGTGTTPVPLWGSTNFQNRTWSGTINYSTANLSATGACCATSGACTTVSVSACNTSGGVFQGTSVACTSTACAPTGACCDSGTPAGTCSALTAAACATKGPNSMWIGAGTACATVTCPKIIATAASNSSGSAPGLFFNISATGASILVTRIDVASGASNLVTGNFDMYTYEGSYVGHDTDSTGWTFVGNFSLAMQPLSTIPTHFDLPTPIYVAQGTTKAVYLQAYPLTLPSGVSVALFRNTSTTQTVTNADVTLFSDRYRFGGPFGGSITGASAGGIGYIVLTGASGACCQPDGSCSSIAASACTAAGGRFLGENLSCAGSPCPPASACCRNDGSCTFLSQSLCASAGGVWQTGGESGAVTCAGASCPNPGACCSSSTSTCQVMSAGQCGAAAGTYRGNGTACLASCALPPPHSVAIMGADSNAGLLDVQAKLRATGQFPVVSIIPVNAPPLPPPALLNQFGAVLNWANGSFWDPNGLGNELADYVDGGGGVVMAVFGNTTNRNTGLNALGGALGGRWDTSLPTATYAVASSNTFTRPTGSFLSVPLVAGETVVTSGFANAANNVMFTVQSVTATTLTTVENTLVPEAAAAGRTINLGVTGTFAIGGGGTGNPSTITRSSGDWLASGFLPGQRISLSGFNTAATNNNFTIATVTPTAISLTQTNLTVEAAGANRTVQFPYSVIASPYQIIPNGGGNVFGFGSLGNVLNPSHPIMQGVNSFVAGSGAVTGNTGGGGARPVSTALNATGVLVAQWSDGKTLVAVDSAKPNRADLGFSPVSNSATSNAWDATTDGARIMANALSYVQSTPVGYGACCQIDGSCVFGPSADCNVAQGAFQGGNTVCAAIACPAPGACCSTSGVCTTVPAFACPTTSIASGPGSSCDLTTCAKGACCKADGTCTSTFQSWCATTGGSFVSVGSTCEAAGCPQPGGCCIASGGCVKLTSADCAAAGGTFAGVGFPCASSGCWSAPTLYNNGGIVTHRRAAPVPLVAGNYGLFGVGSSSTITQPSGNFTTGANAFAAGQTVYVSGFSNAANNGVFHIASVVALTITLVETTLVPEPAAAGRSIIVTNAGSFGVGTSSTFIRTTGDFTTAVLFPGAAITTAGFSNPANNGYFHITGVTSTTLTIAESTLVPEGESSGRAITLAQADASLIVPGTTSPDANDKPWGNVPTNVAGGPSAGNYRIADDFTIPSGQTWTINRVRVPACQKSSSPAAVPYSALYVRIWDRDPRVSGATVVFGDMFANVLDTSASSFANVDRVFGFTPTEGNTRPVYNLVSTTLLNPDNSPLTLGPGTYWIELASAYTGQFDLVPAVHTPSGGTIVEPFGNAISFNANTNAWTPLVDPLYRSDTYSNAGGFPITIPFVIEGSSTGGGGAGVCCRGSTCNASVAQASCTAAAPAGASFAPAVSVCNAGAGTTSPCCYADFNKTNGITVQDIFDFLNAWFGGSPYAVFAGDGSGGSLAVHHIFDFLSAWFAGGC